jgi:hypothetical protein
MIIKTIKQKIVILLPFDDLQEHAIALYDNMTSKIIKQKYCTLATTWQPAEHAFFTFNKPNVKPLLLGQFFQKFPKEILCKVVAPKNKFG